MRRPLVLAFLVLLVPLIASAADLGVTASPPCAVRSDKNRGLRPDARLGPTAIAALSRRMKRSACNAAASSSVKPRPTSSSSSSRPSARASSGITLSTTATISEIPVRRGTRQAVFLPLTIRASCGRNAEMTSLILTHHGTGTALDVANILPLIEGESAGAVAYDPLKQRWNVTFDPPLFIPSCSSVLMTVIGDIPTRARPLGDHQIAVDMSAHVGTVSASVGGDFPIRGPLYRVR